MEEFESYLETQGLKAGTVFDYMGRVSRVARAEKLTINNLPNKIATLVQDYSKNGPKSNVGIRSHCSVINALKHFLKFTTIAETKKA